MSPPWKPIADILSNGVVEQYRLLADHTNVVSQPPQVEVFNISAINGHLLGGVTMM